MQIMDDQDERIASIFNMDEVPEVTEETLSIYLKYIKDNIDTTCEITGIEDFEWGNTILLALEVKKNTKNYGKQDHLIWIAIKLLHLKTILTKIMGYLSILDGSQTGKNLHCR